MHDSSVTDSVTADAGLGEMAAAVEALVPNQGRVALGIAGAPGAGKTTLAEALVAELSRRNGAEFVAHVPMDGLHLADIQLDHRGIRDRKGAPETFDAWGYAALLQRLRRDLTHPVYAPGFDRDLEQPIAGAVLVPPSARIVVTEGNYLLLDDDPWHAARAALDQVWWVEVDDALRTQRLIARHVQFGKEPEVASAWVTHVDNANAARVQARAAFADRVVHAVADGWRLSP